MYDLLIVFYLILGLGMYVMIASAPILQGKRLFALITCLTIWPYLAFRGWYDSRDQ